MRLPRRENDSRGPLKRVWRKLNQVVEYLECLRPNPSAHYAVHWTNKGWTIVPRATKNIEGPEEPANSGVRFMVVRAIFSNHIVCRELYDTAAQQNITVLKPLHLCPGILTYSAWATATYSSRVNTVAYSADGGTRTRSVTESGIPEMSVPEIVWPPWTAEGTPQVNPNFENLVLVRDLGSETSDRPVYLAGTGEILRKKPDAGGPAATAVRFIDTNELFCRAWLPSVEPWRVCQNNTLYWAPFVGGPKI